MPSHGSILLGEVAQHLASVDIACNFCDRRRQANINRLMSEHGPEMPIPTLLRLLSADWLNGSPSLVGCICRNWRTYWCQRDGRHDRSRQRMEGRG
jgi:hypothetical protein